MMEYFDVDKMKEMGQRIKDIRKKRSLKQSELAEELGISTDQMSNIENGKSACKPDYIFQLVQILGVSSDYLFFGKEEVNVNKGSMEDKIMMLLKEADDYEKDKIYRMISIMLEKKTA